MLPGRPAHQQRPALPEAIWGRADLTGPREGILIELIQCIVSIELLV